MQNKLLTVEDLAERLRKTPAAVRTQLHRRPTTLPPPIRVPGSRFLRWREEDISKWEEAHLHVVPTPARRGRPRGK